jgi:hypothetical protein
MDQQLQELIEKLKASNNILVTVSSNPSVDQLAACIGMTLLLNKLKKHATAVFSGEVPSTIEFLKPEQTIEKNTDSLRDFIISLDKSKADKLRYKVEDRVVKIFITPYKTSISQNDLEFSQGDFNVDVVLCLGVNQQQDLDQAITAHGRILHDAVVASVNTQPVAQLGTINWTDTNASSLSELVTQICEVLGKDLLDAQIATALLTGIVAETDRFSNEKTSPVTMRLSAELMSAGANQQLVANALEVVQPVSVSEPPVEPVAKPPAAKLSQDGTLEITHSQTDDEPILDELAAESEEPDVELPEPVAPTTYEVPDEPLFDNQEEPELPLADPTPEQEQQSEISSAPASRMMLQPPSLGGTLTANSTVEQDNNLPDLLTGQPTNDQPLLTRDTSETTLPELQDLAPSSPMPDLPGVEAPQLPEPPFDQVAPAVQLPPIDQPLTPAPVMPSLTPLEPPVLPVTDDQIQVDSNNIQLPGATPPIPVAPTLQPTDTLFPGETPNAMAPLNDPLVPMPMPEPPQTIVTDATDGQNLEAARDAVASAIGGLPVDGPLEPKQDLGASGYLNVQSLPEINDGVLNPVAPPPAEPPVPDLTEAAAAALPIEQPQIALAPPTYEPASAYTVPPPEPNVAGPDIPPPVPPPLPLDDLSKFTNPTTPANS